VGGDRWKDGILVKQHALLEKVFLVIRNVIFALVVIFTLSFILIDVVLFSGSSEKSIAQIALNGEVLTDVSRVMFLARNAHSLLTDESVALLAAAGRSVRALLAQQFATLSSEAQRNWFDNSEIRLSVTPPPRLPM
jgi:hypothetical protein